MMRDQNLELAYIAGCLYGNIKPREFRKENQIELRDVIRFKAPYNKNLKANRQPGKHSQFKEEILGQQRKEQLTNILNHKLCNHREINVE